MQKISSIVNNIVASFPEFRFLEDEENRWSPNNKTVHYDPSTNPAYLLHEIAHGILEHTSYARDIELLAMERDAWDYAKDLLATRFDIKIDDEIIVESIDSYRDWLHSRSLCPRCEATGLQKSGDRYGCINCGTNWRVNEAKSVGLKRHQN